MNVIKATKKPVTVEAVRVDADDYDGLIEIIRWCGGHPVDFGPAVVAIDTLEGTMYANGGDWIIRGVQGEFYPCKPDIFTATYTWEGSEPVGVDESATHAEYMAGLREAELTLDCWTGENTSEELAAALYWVGDQSEVGGLDRVRAYAALRILGDYATRPAEERA